jgi:hypothetical protein
MWKLLGFNDLRALNLVAASDSIDDLHAFNHLTEDRVAAIEMRLKRVCDEELTAAGVFA